MYKNSKVLTQFVQEKIESRRVLVIGDVMLDKYYFSEVKRISPEAPVPIARVVKEKETLGGAANVAHNLALLGCTTYLSGAVGDDYHRVSLEEKLDSNCIVRDGLICTQGPTTTKLRIMGGHQQMLRLDFEETAPISTDSEQKLCAYVERILQSGIDSVIISDYAKGLCTLNLCQEIIKTCNQYDVPVIVDPKGNEWQKYRGADLITPNLKELNEIMPYKVENEDQEVKKAASMVKKKFGIKNVLVTRSEQGLSLIGTRKTMHIPTLAQEVFDVSGAGDTVISVLGAALAGKVPLVDAAYLANLAASIVVAKLGTYAVSKEELMQALLKAK